MGTKSAQTRSAAAGGGVMTLLDFARGPALQWSIVIFVFGVVLRVLGATLMVYGTDYAKARSTKTWRAGYRTIALRFVGKPQFREALLFSHVVVYGFHIAMFVVILFFAPHIFFFEDILGLSWPSLPNGAITVLAALAVAILIALMYRRLHNPVLRTISNADDYVSWLATIAPLVTGLLAYLHIGLRYETMLAIHFLSVELLLIWFPFGKLMHTIFVFESLGMQGAVFERRGVKA
jgi:nitrate reductase gamma subunit